VFLLVPAHPGSPGQRAVKWLLLLLTNANMWLGHMLRHGSLLHDIIEERMKGKTARGRKRLHLLSDTEVKQEAHCSRQTRLESWNVRDLLVASED